MTACGHLGCAAAATHRVMVLAPMVGPATAGRLVEIVGVDGCREHADVRLVSALVKQHDLARHVVLFCKAAGVPPPDFSRALVRSVVL